jgi:hydroxymethylbilane synthase
MSEKTLVIGTRGSKLALTQSEQIAALLRAAHPGLTVELQIISTKGDRILDVALSAVGDKGLFVKEIETALLAHEVDLAVHSCKDMPSMLPDGLTLAAFPKRVDPRDALVLPLTHAAPSTVATGNPLDLLPQGATVGTGSLRRACQLQALRPDLQLRDVRGNVDTRLRKLDEGQYDAIILATAGLSRLGLRQRISCPLPPEVMLPAVAQGTLAIEARSADSVTLDRLGVLDDPATRVAALTERAFLRRLEGGCQVPIAAHAALDAVQSGMLRLSGLVGALDGSVMVRGEKTGDADDPEGLGLALAEELLVRGAGDLLAAIRPATVNEGSA